MAPNKTFCLFRCRVEKINKLCSVMGTQWINTNPNFDPDRAYELTTDNVKKIMAIHMRFRYVLCVAGLFNRKH